MTMPQFRAIVVVPFLLFVSSAAVLPDMPEERTDRIEALDPCSPCANSGGMHSFGLVGELYDCPASETGCHPEPINGTCQQWHQSCFAPLAAMDDLDAAIGSGDVEQLRRVVAKHSVATINVQRGAVQVIGCDGTFVANYQVSAEVLSALIE